MMNGERLSAQPTAARASRLRVAASIVLIVGVALIGPCMWCAEQPGAGTQATACYRSSNTLMRAVYQHKKTTGKYPSSIHELTSYNSSIRSLEHNTCVPEYQSAGAEFVISFQYSGPGTNHCAYESTSRKWFCVGAF